jgi:hypothetical protein
MIGFKKLVQADSAIERLQNAGYTYLLNNTTITFKADHGTIIISKSLQRRNVIYLDIAPYFTKYGISEKDIRYRREWSQDEESIQAIYDFILTKLLPVILRLKGPFNVNKTAYYTTIIEAMGKHGYDKYSEGRRIFQIPYYLKNKLLNTLTEISQSLESDYIQFDLPDNCSVYFAIDEGKTYYIIFSQGGRYWLYSWYKYGSIYKEGVDCIKEMAEGFVNDWENLKGVPIPLG